MVQKFHFHLNEKRKTQLHHQTLLYILGVVEGNAGKKVEKLKEEGK